MSDLNDREKGEAQKSSIFPTTHWSVVLSSAHGDDAMADAALQKLCKDYWYPLYAFIRSRGYDSHTSEDLTQSFFAHLLGIHALKTVNRQKGKFRTFLLASLTNFLLNEHDKQSAKKRGGGREIISWDALEAEEAYRHEPRTTPDKVFDNAWAETVTRAAMNRLRSEHSSGAKAPLFKELSPFLTTGLTQEATATRTARLGMTEGALKVSLHRLRRRFGELLRSQVAYTVSSPEQVEDEIRHLLSVLGDAA
jgi:RNA polymerase sigma-70 factor (ECF subfamily)